MTGLERDIHEYVEAHLSDKAIHGNFRPEGGKVVHDGLWGTLHLSPLEVFFIDTPLAQRLRHIHQMGCANYVYPSTTHTRFEHTLGVMSRVAKFREALRSAKGGSDEWIEPHAERLRLTALFHDLGHGLFSHTSEEVYALLDPMRKLRRDHDDEPAAHELLSYLIVRSKPFKELCENACDRCSKAGRLIECGRIADDIIGEPTAPEHHYLRDIINGPFDADKIDYLFRDSHFSGLPVSIDLDRLWHSTTVAKAMGQQRLVVTHGGATSLEQIFFAKMVLTSAVYHHHKARAYDCMFAGIIAYLRRHPGIEVKVRDKVLKWDSPVDFLWLTDGDLMRFAYARPEGDPLHRLIHNLYFRRPLVRAMVLNLRTIGASEDDWQDKLKRYAKVTPRARRFTRELARDIWEKTNTKAGRQLCEPQEIWLDLPQLPSTVAAEDTFVLPAKDEKPIPLCKVFPIGVWAKQYGLHKYRGHVFCPPELRDKVAPVAREVIESRFGFEVLDAAFKWCKTSPPPRPQGAGAPGG